MIKHYEESLLKNLSKYNMEEICEELYEIKKNLMWLNDNIILSNGQRELFNDIQKRISKLLGCKRF